MYIIYIKVSFIFYAWNKLEIWTVFLCVYLTHFPFAPKNWRENIQTAWIYWKNVKNVLKYFIWQVRKFNWKLLSAILFPLTIFYAQLNGNYYFHLISFSKHHMQIKISFMKKSFRNVNTCTCARSERHLTNMIINHSTIKAVFLPISRTLETRCNWGKICNVTLNKLLLVFRLIPRY